MVKLVSVLFPVLAVFFTVLWTLTTLVRVLLAIMIRPSLALKKTRREVPPACLLDPSLGSHEYVTANGIKFHYVAAGDRTKPLMLLLHGFPEFWFSWRYQLREFCQDYWVVAIDMRGYGNTERPPNKEDYRIECLTQDIVELIPALGYSSCTLVAHDWGGIPAWLTVQNHPELVKKFVALNIPHPRVYMRHLTSSWGQLMKSWYMFMFQVPWLPEFIFTLRDYGYFNAIFRGRKAGARNRAAFPPDVVEAFKYTFSQPGAITPTLNYHRCMFQYRNKAKKSDKKAIQVPTLVIWGDDDFFLEKELADGHSSFVNNITIKHIPNCSHWVQQDAPDLVNQYIKEFIETNMD